MNHSVSIIHTNISDNLESKETLFINRFIKEDIYSTTIIIPTENYFVQGMLTTRFNVPTTRDGKAIIDNDIFCFINQLRNIKNKKYIIIPYIHLMPTSDFLILLRWIKSRVNEIKHIIFIGSIDIISWKRYLQNMH